MSETESENYQCVLQHVSVLPGTLPVIAVGITAVSVERMQLAEYLICGTERELVWKRRREEEREEERKRGRRRGREGVSVEERKRGRERGREEEWKRGRKEERGREEERKRGS